MRGETIKNFGCCPRHIQGIRFSTFGVIMESTKENKVSRKIYRNTKKTNGIERESSNNKPRQNKEICSQRRSGPGKPTITNTIENLLRSVNIKNSKRVQRI